MSSLYLVNSDIKKMEFAGQDEEVAQMVDDAILNSLNPEEM